MIGWVLYIIVVFAVLWAYEVYSKPRAKFHHIGTTTHSFSLQPVGDIPETTGLAGSRGSFLAITKNGKVYSNPFGSKQLLLDLKKEPVQFTDAHMEQGLMGVAVGSDLVYLSFTAAPTQKNRKTDLVVVEYAIIEQTLEPRREIFRHSFREPYHHGGTIALGLDGALYLSTGDGGPQKDPFNEAQNLHSPAGKILRFKLDQPDPNPQIVASGLRNPWRMSFDDKGQLWIGDVGFDTFESVYKFSTSDVISGRRPPPNFAWPEFEGSKQLRGNKPFSAFEAPIFEYPNGNKTGLAIIGGEYDSRTNIYVFGDWIGIIRGLQFNKKRKRWEQIAELKMPEKLLSFGKDSRTGDIYALGEKKIYKVSSKRMLQ